MEYRFKTEITHDLQTHKEFNRTYNHGSLPLAIIGLVYTAAAILNMTMFSDPSVVIRFLTIAVVALVLYLVTHPKNGDIQYKRLLQNYGGEPPQMVYTFRDDGIHCTEQHSGNKHFYSYDLFRRVIESPRMILLVLQHRSCILVDKSQLEGGTSEELLAWFFEKCPNIRRKKSRRTGFGKWVDRIFIVTLIVGTLLALLNFPGFSLMNKLTGRLDNSNSYQEMADALTPLGITITEQTIEELEAYDADYFADYGEDYYSGRDATLKVSDLLYWEGSGVYDDVTYEWTPSSSGVYWVELEVMDAGSIYTDFLAGLAAMDADLRFTNIREDYSNADLMNSSGSVEISFDWNGEHHEMEAYYNSDWFDTDMLYAVGRIIAADDNPRDLYFSSGDDLGLLLYYGDAGQIRQLEKLTGLNFYDTVTMRMGH